MLACAQHQTSENCQLVAAVANLIETVAGQVWLSGTYFSGWENG
jgi:hypothetical protein